MTNTLGKKLMELRREKGWTQEEVAEKLGVSAQAISKWENDLSCPDILLLPEISKLYGVSIDELLSNTPEPTVTLLDKEKRKNIEDMMLRVVVNSKDGDKVKVNLPMPLVKIAIEMGVTMPQVSGNDALKSIDLTKIFKLVEQGVIGKLVEVESNDGDFVEVMVE